MDSIAPFHSVLTSSNLVYVIGVAGDSGSGKTTFASAIRHVLGDDIAAIISLDDYHLYDRKERKIRGITPLSPLANDLDRLERDVSLLKQGLPIEKPVYDHTTGTIRGPFPFQPVKILILEGLFPFFSEKLRRLCNFTLYVDPDSDVKKEWKLKRDTSARGYTEREVREERAQREADYVTYILPQRQHANAVAGISFSRFGRGLGWEEDVYRVTLTFSPWDHFPPGEMLSFDPGNLFRTWEKPFSLEFRPGDSRAEAGGTLEADGFLPIRSAANLIRYVEKTTGRNPLSDMQAGSMLTPILFAQLFLCGCIIAHRLSLSGADYPGKHTSAGKL